MSINTPALLTEGFDGSTTVGTGATNDWIVIDEGDFGGPSIWSITAGELVQSSNILGGPVNADATNHQLRVGTYAYWADSVAQSWSDYTVTVDVRSGDDDGIGVMFYYQDNNNYYRFEMDTQRSYAALSKVVGGVRTSLAVDDTVTSVQNQDYTLQITIAADGTISVYRDTLGTPLLTATDTDLTQGTVALFCWGNTDSLFDDVEVGTVAY